MGRLFYHRFVRFSLGCGIYRKNSKVGYEKAEIVALSKKRYFSKCASKPQCFEFGSVFSSHSNGYLQTLSKVISNDYTRPNTATMSSLQAGDCSMGTDIVSVQDIQNADALEKYVNACSTHLLNGGVIAVPTDTIYGIAGLCQKMEAVHRIYEIKQRNYEKPVAISVGKVDDIYRWSKVTVPRQLLSDLLPGPVTVVFERSPELNPSLNPDTTKVGIRIPGNAFMQQLAQKCNSPIALTSANISGGSSCLKIEEFEHLWPHLDLVVNGGVLNDTEESRLGSTVVDLSVPGFFRIIRNGSAHQPTVKVLQDTYKLKNATSLTETER